MKPQIIGVPGLPPANATYSQASALGDLVFVSGQLGIDPATGHLAEGGIQAQTRQAIENIITILAACGTSLDRVAKVTLFLADFSLLAEANQIYAQYFTHRPAKTGVGIDQLWGGALIEIEVIASRT
ncbi:MAG: Rid family detoxifying hydrolase [Acidobacteria bacterium]|nr:Rid family detoxifying hydrolase [Acidobacteriota bacterium]